MSTVTKLGSQGKWQWSNLLYQAGWTINEENIKEKFSEVEAEIIMEKHVDGINVLVTEFYLPKRKWIFYPLGLHDYNVDNVGTEEGIYQSAESVPIYNIYQTLWEDGKWSRAGKIGFCLPKDGSVGKYLYIPILFKNDKARKMHYQMNKMSRNNRVRTRDHRMNKGLLIKRPYFIYDIEDDYTIEDKARLMYTR
tara:strand:- start:186 stop:767 length:582 start_codon:yes stop_codon:yes gene_type:complete